MGLFLAWATAAAAQELPRSPACRTALQALEQAEDALADSAAAASTPIGERQRQVAARLQPLRRRVADACLGGLTDSPPPSQHTWIAPSPPLPPRADANAPRMAALPPATVPPPRFETPPLVTHCSAAVCFTSDGSTLTRVGPTLVGPRGACAVQGGFLRCP